MSLIRCDGFDTYGAGLAASHTTMLSSGFYTDSPGGGEMCDLVNVNRTGYGNSLSLGPLQGGHMAFDAAGDIVFGMAFYSDALDSKTVCYGAFDNYLGSVVEKFRISTSVTGVIVCQFGAAEGVIYSPVNTMFNSTWHYVEGRIKLSASSDGVIEIRVDGNAAISYTGPTISGAAKVNMLGWTGVPAFHAPNLIDDLYLLRQDGVGLTDFLGDCIVRALLPVSDASPNEMTKTGGVVSHASAVGENPSDEDASYLSSNVHGQSEFFNLSTIPDTTVDILAVQVNARMRKDAAGVSKYKIGLRSDTTTVWSPEKAPSLNYTTQFLIVENDPNGGGSWNKASVEATKIGIGIV